MLLFTTLSEYGQVTYNWFNKRSGFYCSTFSKIKKIPCILYSVHGKKKWNVKLQHWSGFTCRTGVTWKTCHVWPEAQDWKTRSQTKAIIFWLKLSIPTCRGRPRLSSTFQSSASDPRFVSVISGQEHTESWDCCLCPQRSGGWRQTWLSLKNSPFIKTAEQQDIHHIASSWEQKNIQGEQIQVKCWKKIWI